MTHTPTPWAWRDEYDFREHSEHRGQGLAADCDNIRCGRIELVSGDPVTSTTVVLSQWADFAGDAGLDIETTDAEFIATACNAYDDLLNTLRGIVNIAGGPTADYAPEVAARELRIKLDRIGRYAGDAIRKAGEPEG